MIKGFFKLIIASVLIVFIVVVAVVSSSSDKSALNNADRPDTQRPQITAALSDFTVDRDLADFVFTLTLEHEQPTEGTYYTVVYGKNDMYTPPRRSAWPMAGVLFHHAGTRRGQLSASRISRNWHSKPKSAKGAELVLEPHGSKSLEGALPLNEICQHEAWRGERLDPRSIYNEIYLWVFSKDGDLIYDKKYDVN